MALLDVLTFGLLGPAVKYEEARQSRKKAERARLTQQAAESRRSAIQQIREARIQRAQVEQAGATQGGDSSMVEGARASIGAAAAGNIQFINQNQRFNEIVSNNLMRAQTLQAQGQALQSFIDLGAKAGGSV